MYLGSFRVDSVQIGADPDHSRHLTEIAEVQYTPVTLKGDVWDGTSLFAVIRTFDLLSFLIS